MLVKITDIKDNVVWINPIYVKAVAQSKKGVTEIYIAYGSQWNQQTSIKVRAGVDEVAEAISAAMPMSMLESVAAADQTEQEAEATRRAAAVAASSG